jgi:hypothetical protein
MAEKRKRGGALYRDLANQDASRRGLAPAEYGVYKGSVGSAVQPVNSASGLLILSIILTVIMAAVSVFIVIVIMQAMGLAPVVEGDSEITPVMWFFVVISYGAPIWAWVLYAKERRAQKLRLAQGLPRNLS